MKSSDLINEIEKSIHEGDISNDEMVQLIEVVGSYLNLKTIPCYAKVNNMTYNGVKKCRKIVKLYGVKFVIDNQ